MMTIDDLKQIDKKIQVMKSTAEELKEELPSCGYFVTTKRGA